MKKDLLSIADLGTSDILALFELAKRLKAETKSGGNQPLLKGKTLAMIFEKPSLRTRATFEIGMFQLGGHAIYLAPSDIQMGGRESVSDIARNLSRWVDGIMARVFAHATVEELADAATVPVINGLSDLTHPCQGLTDLFTVWEHKSNLAGLKLAYIGDGFNVAHSLLFACSLLGVNVAVACPEGYEPQEKVVALAKQFAGRRGSTVEITDTPHLAAQGSDVLYTDVWTSMGQESEAEARRKAFDGFQLNADLVGQAKPDAIVMHDQPAHRGEEITDEVMDGPQSVVFDQAENRLHVQKAVLVTLLGRK